MASSKKLNFAPLRKVMDQIDDNGKHGRCGNWEMGLGGYDHGYEIYYRGAPIGRVNYEFREYELYDEDFMPKELIPEFLAAIDARKFKDIGYHEEEDEFIDDDGTRYVQESIGNLESFLAEKEREFEPSGVNQSWDLSEDKVWAVQEYLSQMGEFTDEDREYLRKTDPELLSLEEDDDQNMVDESRKQIMWAVNFRNMRTAVHGMYYGKDRKRVEAFAKQLEYIQKDCLDVPSEEYPFMFDDLFADYPDIKCEEEIDWHDIVDLPGGYEGIETDNTIYRFVNRVSLDLDMVFGESTRKQKMKFRNIVSEGLRTQDEDYEVADALEEYANHSFPAVRKVVAGSTPGMIAVMLRSDVYLNAKDAKELAQNLLHGAGVKGWKYASFNNMENYISIVSRQFRESTRKQKMKFKKIVKESSNVAKFRRSIEAAKNRIIRKVDRNGIVENLGQDEVRRLRDALDDYVGDGKKETYMEADEGKNYDSDTPKIYVGTYAKYNDGSIDGKWIDLTDYNTYEEFLDACRELHSDEKDPEFMVQDYENFPQKWYHEGGLPTEEEFDKINEYYMMDDSRKEAYEVFVNYTGLDSIEDFEDAYEGQFNSPEDFGYYAVETWGIPDNPEYYIDYESFGRDLTMDWHQGDPDETDAEGEPEDPDYYYDNDGYQQMEYGSDREVGEQYIDDIGLDNLGTDTLNNYFDYEEYGRTLLINDFWEDAGYVFREI